MVSRLDNQKGLDLLLQALDDVLALDAGLVVLGSGNEEIERDLGRAVDEHRGRVALRTGLDDALAHRIMGGADLFLIPSRYEPCGLTQMYAMRYGTVPVVRATGGLEDTVTAYDARSGSGNGFKFREIDPQALLGAVREAVGVFEDRPRWERLRASAMAAEFSWDRAAGDTWSSTSPFGAGGPRGGRGQPDRSLVRR